MGWGIKKRNLFSAGLFLLTLYFIFDGFNSIVEYQRKAQDLDRKIYNIEAHIQNNYGNLFAAKFRQFLPY